MEEVEPRPGPSRENGTAVIKTIRDESPEIVEEKCRWKGKGRGKGQKFKTEDFPPLPKKVESQEEKKLEADKIENMERKLETIMRMLTEKRENSPFAPAPTLAPALAPAIAPAAPAGPLYTYLPPSGHTQYYTPGLAAGTEFVVMSTAAPAVGHTGEMMVSTSGPRMTITETVAPVSENGQMTTPFSTSNLNATPCYRSAQPVVPQPGSSSMIVAPCQNPKPPATPEAGKGVEMKATVELEPVSTASRRAESEVEQPNNAGATTLSPGVLEMNLEVKTVPAGMEYEQPELKIDQEALDLLEKAEDEDEESSE